MIGLVIVSHENFAEGILAATQFVIGPLAQCATVSIQPGDDLEIRRGEIAKAIRSTDTGKGVVVATDLFGGTPSNLSISLMDSHVEVIAGVNLPMLIRFNSVRKSPLSECVAMMRDAGRKYITVASDLLHAPAERADTENVVQSGGRNIEMSETASAAAVDTNRLIRSINWSSVVRIGYGGIGHNLPPLGFTIEDKGSLEETETAADVAAIELQKPTPRKEVLRLCLAALKRGLKLLKAVATWSISKGDLFITEATKSAGKTIGSALVISTLIASLTGQLADLVAYLEAFVGI